ncbi:hypothetical protein AB0D10_38035 [Kitasatospora sp. NPDC048545]|uniref:hypothetical protein n=1 Tax=Kitasatospora sp. NPDC048545 TaxID=3157208 RepID=UPI0033D8390E
MFRSGPVVGGVLLLAGCSGGGGGGGGGTAATSATATPYGTTLDQVLAPVNTGLGKAAAATTTFELDTALAGVESNIGRAVRNLNAVTAPAGADPARTDLVNGLTALASESSALRGDVLNHKVCTVGAAQASLGAGPGMAAVSAALAELTAAGYQPALVVPQLPKPHPQARALENGTPVRDGGKGGKRALKVVNDNGPADAVFTIAQDGKAVASVYAAKGKSTTIEGIKDGAYDVYVATGADWDSDVKQFTQDCRYVKFREKYAFPNPETGTGWVFDLTPVRGEGGAPIEGQTANSAPQP